MEIKTIKIGDVEIKQTAALAPMASVADRAYRLVCKEHGAAYMVSEMISAKGLCYSDRKTEELCTVDDRERPYALQIFFQAVSGINLSFNLPHTQLTLGDIAKQQDSNRKR